MRELVSELRRLMERGCPVAYCRLVETRGSTPQKAGAGMLVLPDGGQRGTLGGGCVEAEVKRRALGVLQQGQSEIVTFQLDSDYGWDDGLICGGRMRVLIDPLACPSSVAYFACLEELLTSRQGGTEGIVLDSRAEGPPVGSSWLFDATGQPRARRPASCDEDQWSMLRQQLPPWTRTRRAAVAAGIAWLPLTARCRLVIVGGGHVGQAVAELAGQLDFDVWIVDDRQEYVSADRFPAAAHRLCGPLEQLLPQLEMQPDTYCLIVTRGHNHDQLALYHLVQRGARYVGMIGSRRKIRLILDNLMAEGIPAAALAQVYAPVGIEIGSQTVPEIAVSICAELVAHRNQDGRVPGRPAPVWECPRTAATTTEDEKASEREV